MNEQFHLISNEETNPFKLDENDVDLVNPKHFTVEEDEDGKEDVKIDI